MRIGEIIRHLIAGNFAADKMVRHLVRQTPGQPPQLIPAPTPAQGADPLAAVVESTVGPDHGLRPQEVLQVRVIHILK